MNPEARAKRSIHVFASDFLPYPGLPRTAGGNRSLQVISALRNAGHRVTFSMPLTNYLGKQNAEQVLAGFSEEEIWASKNFYEPNIVLNRIGPDVAVFCNINMFRTVSRFSKDIVYIVDCYGPLQFESLLIDASDHEAAMQDGSLLEERCRALVDRMRGIDYMVTVSERQKYFWSAYCSLAGFNFNDLDVLVCPAAFQVPQVTRNPAPNLTVVYSGGFYPWQNPDRFLRAAASALNEIKDATLHIFGGPHAGLPNEQAARELLNDLQQFDCVKYHGYRPVEELTATLATAWCALEMMERNIERELAITGRTIEFLSAGTPVIYNDFSTLSELVRKYNAGWTLSPDSAGAGLRSIFKELVERGPALVQELSQNARRLAAAEFVPDRCMDPLIQLCDGELPKRVQSAGLRRSSSAVAAQSDLGRVLAISPDTGALRELRVSNPLRALQRQGQIQSFRLSDSWFNGLKDDMTTYNTVLIQRAVPAFVYQIFRNLGVPFVLDVDDNLLARASYRRHERVEAEILTGLSYCTALTAPNPRLAVALEKYSGLSLVPKTFITPNALPFGSEFLRRRATQPEQIIWIQSDIAALGASREEVVSAVEEFSVKHELPIMLVGRKVLSQPQFTHQVVMGELDFVSNLQMLQFSPTSIGVAPLETNDDDETLDFVAGKSDLKMLLFGGFGHGGIYSAAPPYTDSPLRPDLCLIGNSREEWSEALEYQLRRGWQCTGRIAARIQSERHIDAVASQSWLPALRSSVSPRPVRGAELYEAYEASSKMSAGPASSIAYLLGNQDILNFCLEHEDSSAEKHFGSYGNLEGRHFLHSTTGHEQLVRDLGDESQRWLSEASRKRHHVAKNTRPKQEHRDGSSAQRVIATEPPAVDQDSADFPFADLSISEAELKKLQGTISSLEAELTKSQDIVSGIVRSRSWRVTAPLRKWAEKSRRG